MASNSSSSSSNNNNSHQLQNYVEPIRVTQVARNHPLFPILSLITRQIEQNRDLIERQQKGLQEIKELQKELHGLIEKHCKSTFSLKQGGFENSLRIETAGAFCESLSRDLSDVCIQRAVRKVLKEEAKEKYKFDKAVKYMKKQMSTFKTEERRKVYGISPCEKYSRMNSHDFALAFMKYMNAPDAKYSVYIKHLIILRKFVREVPEARENKDFYTSFKKWRQSKYGPDGVPSSDQCQGIISEDEKFNYLGVLAIPDDEGEEGSNDVIEEPVQNVLYSCHNGDLLLFQD